METHVPTRPTLTLVTPERAPAATITATIVTQSSMHEYRVRELQVDHADLRAGPALPVRRVFEVILRVPFYPPIRVHGRLERAGAEPRIAFIHTDDFTEDHIQAALLSELERCGRLN